MLYALAAKYGIRILVVLLVVSSVVYGYFSWKHEIVAETLLKERAAVDAQSLKLISERSAEIKMLKEKHDAKFRDTVRFYADHIETISNEHNIAINRRLRVSTSSCDARGRIPKTDVPERDNTGRSGIYESSELAAEAERRFNESLTIIEKGALACGLLIDAVEETYEIK